MAMPVVGPGSAQSQWAQQFQQSPIFLTGGTGIATGGDIPITSYTGKGDGTLPFAVYMPVPGASLLKNLVSTFPFANQAVAANAIIQQPIELSMMMVCPVPPGGSWKKKLSVLTGLITTVNQHINAGGLFNVMTPSFPYTNGLLTSVRDVSQNETRQPQYKYQWDFFFPLITLLQAQAVLNTLLNNLTNQSAPNPTVPTVATALAATNSSGPQLTTALTSQLAPALAAAGIALGGAQLPGVVGSSVQTALAGDFSPLDLAAHLAAQYQPLTSALGMSPGLAVQLFSTNVNLALGSLGATPNLMQNLFKASLGSVSIPGLNSTAASMAA
jgi:hypothetical protein